MRPLALLPLLAACAPGSSGTAAETDPGTDPAVLFSAAITTVALEVDAAPGAQPYTGGGLGSTDPWDLTEANLDALFDGSKTLEIPREAEDFGSLDAGAGPWTGAALEDLSALHRDDPPTDSRATFHALWLDGYYADGTGERRDVLGVSLGGTSIIAMFKPVIAGASSFETIQTFTEQVTLTHELGHAIGLVNNGVSPTTAHHDAEHGAHCTNDRCVMYYAVEGPGDVVEFVQEYVVTGSTVLFDEACLDDIAAARDAAN